MESVRVRQGRLTLVSLMSALCRVGGGAKEELL